MRPKRREEAAATAASEGRFRRSLGLLLATEINMTQMCGIGPFITIPLMVATIGGPQAIVGWVAGAALVMADGLVWSELGAAMPGADGSYLYLGEAFHRTGKLMPFICIWTALLTVPLILGSFLPHLGYWEGHAIGIALTGFVVLALYRRIESIRVITVCLWLVCWRPSRHDRGQLHGLSRLLCLHYPAGAFGGGLLGGLGSGLIIGIDDYLGYYTVAEMGDELADPGRVTPRSIIISIATMMVIYLALNIGVVGTLPWRVVAKSTSVASAVATHNWGHGPAAFVTVLILLTAFASVFAGLLGGSRLPYNAARDRVFFRLFDRLHPPHDFPHVSLLVRGMATAAASFFSLTTVINLLLAVTVIVQSVAQIVALTVLRRRQPELHRPYTQWLTPYRASPPWPGGPTSTSRRRRPHSSARRSGSERESLPTARSTRAWPFAAREITEASLEQQRAA